MQYKKNLWYNCVAMNGKDLGNITERLLKKIRVRIYWWLMPLGAGRDDFFG